MPHTYDSEATLPGTRVAPMRSDAVVMLHSSLASRSQWTALAERLAPRYRVVALDLHGYGDNPMPVPGPGFTVDDEVRLVTQRIAQLPGPIDRIHLVGHSYGGLVALRFAQVAGPRILSMSLYEPVAFRMLDDDDESLREVKRMAERVSSLVVTGQLQDAAERFVDFWNGDGYFASLSLNARTSIARRIAKVPLDFQACHRYAPRDGDLRAIAMPSLLLVGTRSPRATQRIGALLGAALGNCRVESCEAGHMGPITDAERINPPIERFIDDCTNRAKQSKQERPSREIRMPQVFRTMIGLQSIAGTHDA